MNILCSSASAGTMPLESPAGSPVPMKGSHVELTPRTEEFAGHIGLDLNDPADCQHLWLAKKAVREPLPEGWSQHEDDEGFLFFYDAILDKSSWEHPQEGYWKRLLDDERRRTLREKEVQSIEEQIAKMAEGEEGPKLVRELKARFIKADIASLEIRMQTTRSQIEAMQYTLRNNAPDEEGRTTEQVSKHSDRLKKELRQMNESMNTMLLRLENIMNEDTTQDDAAAKTFEDDDTGAEESRQQDSNKLKKEVIVTPGTQFTFFTSTKVQILP